GGLPLRTQPCGFLGHRRLAPRRLTECWRAANPITVELDRPPSWADHAAPEAWAAEVGQHRASSSPCTEASGCRILAGRMPLPGEDWLACPRCRTALVRVVRGGIPRPSCPR